MSVQNPISNAVTFNVYVVVKRVQLSQTSEYDDLTLCVLKSDQIFKMLMYSTVGERVALASSLP